ncbi:hypothetical protein L226DRAFT_301888 [Lentinus tigrinus ALCF2SS1-7]|uniref:uncharacterized protein n=1 Tax=Lentinus tigrinus ALCF2SS1-7 TaxID=1328758 RepID=UPI0011660CB4|nr:hypothetical protein L226DRAFT_301888 [Lentinus tigrinus ALCF2SS1-7]
MATFFQKVVCAPRRADTIDTIHMLCFEHAQSHIARRGHPAQTRRLRPEASTLRYVHTASLATVEGTLNSLNSLPCGALTLQLISLLLSSLRMGQTCSSRPPVAHVAFISRVLASHCRSLQSEPQRLSQGQDCAAAAAAAGASSIHTIANTAAGVESLSRIGPWPPCELRSGSMRSAALLLPSMSMIDRADTYCVHVSIRLYLLLQIPYPPDRRLEIRSNVRNPACNSCRCSIFADRGMQRRSRGR